MTPLGMPVEPEVYCRKARVSGAIAGEGEGERGGSEWVISQC